MSNIFNTKKKNFYSSMSGFQKESTIVSYTPNKNRNVSTMYSDAAIDLATGECKKPEITFYNLTKGTVDDKHNQRLKGKIVGL